MTVRTGAARAVAHLRVATSASSDGATSDLLYLLPLCTPVVQKSSLKGARPSACASIADSPMDHWSLPAVRRERWRQSQHARRTKTDGPRAAPGL